MTLRYRALQLAWVSYQKNNINAIGFVYVLFFVDFHSMVGVGNLLRKTGAFFMRRSFVNDKLYWHVFKEYMRSLVNVYHTGIEFFIEGTRSRSGKALMPKIGLALNSYAVLG